MDFNFTALLFLFFSLLVFPSSSLAFSTHVMVDLQDTATKSHKSRYEVAFAVMAARRWLREMSTEKTQGMENGLRSTGIYAKGEKLQFSLWGTQNYLESRKNSESSRSQEIHQKDDKSTASMMQFSATARRYLKATASQKGLQDADDQTLSVPDHDYVPMQHRRRSPVHN